MLSSTQPFCFDTLALSQWLQWLLIPRMRRIFAGEGEPSDRGARFIRMAEDCFEHLDDPSTLLMLIERFDRLIRGEAARSRTEGGQARGQTPCLTPCLTPLALDFKPTDRAADASARCHSGQPTVCRSDRPRP